MPTASTSKKSLDVPEEEEQESYSDSLAVLAGYRAKGIRRSEEVVERGEKLLQEKRIWRHLGKEVWPFLEQLAFAALDTGKNDLASICIDRLEQRFPKSPRVDALQGLLLQVEDPEKARTFYEDRLQEDENNVLVRKRLIALHLHEGSTGSSGATSSSSGNLSVQRGVELLVDHLDTVYNDPEGWSQLADTYERLGLLEQALSCIGDLILLEPTNTFHVLRHAETSYTLGDYATAHKYFCRALEMAGPMKDGGLGRRAGLGIKLCQARIDGPEPRSSGTSAGSSGSRSQEVKRSQDIDALVTQELLSAYSKSWTGPGDRVAGHEETKVLRTWLQG